ncbi:MAG: hydroxyisourate hydrolase [Rhodoferax sp.]|jgi:5-hydroxyisourate hydrolase|nr:hydroxyisourate hydrolase [Rhodoferax sp.]
MGLSTHVLDTLHGTPAAGMQGALYALDETKATLIKRFVLGVDGRNPDGLLVDRGRLVRGTYRLVFDVSGYFSLRGVLLPEPNFLNQVNIDFGVAHPDQHYHVPLIVSPWSYSTYRGA